MIFNFKVSMSCRTTSKQIECSLNTRDNSMEDEGNKGSPYLLIGESAGKSVTAGGSNGLSAFRTAVVPSGGGVAMARV